MNIEKIIREKKCCPYFLMLQKMEKRTKLKRYILSLGLIPLREFILKKIGIRLYGTICRIQFDYAIMHHTPMQHTPFRYVDIVTYTDNNLTIQYGYRKCFKKMLITTYHKSPDHIFPIPPSSYQRGPRLGDYKLLLASNFFGIWLIMYLIHKVKRIILQFKE
jgi:hypothetical protein